MEMSSRSNTSCCDYALDYLNWFLKELKHFSGRRIMSLLLHNCYFFTEKLLRDIRLLKTIVLYGSNCRKRKHEKYLWEPDQKEGNNNISLEVEDMVYSFTQDLNSAYLRCHCLALNPREVLSELTRFRVTIKLFFQESGITWLNYYSLGDDGDGQLTMDFIDSLLQNLDDLILEISNRGRKLIYLERTLETLGEKLKFLKSFIGFATLQGMLKFRRIRLVKNFFTRLEKDISFNYFWVRCARLLSVSEFPYVYQYWWLVNCGTIICAKSCMDQGNTVSCALCWMPLLFASRSISERRENLDWSCNSKFKREKLRIQIHFFNVLVYDTVGYGDVLAVNTLEMIFIIFYMLFNFGLTAYTVGNMTNLVVEGTRRTMEFVCILFNSCSIGFILLVYRACKLYNFMLQRNSIEAASNLCEQKTIASQVEGAYTSLFVFKVQGQELESTRAD
ncbi:hypothetical protein ACH5RR_022546 [Cinchona calisaya]|uniref:Potassium channel domain-containing protein n=1 Tax=Cinchona calisaya TaxID=153742 RepID=A0ABD2Z980_9GENT